MTIVPFRGDKAGPRDGALLGPQLSQALGSVTPPAMPAQLPVHTRAPIPPHEGAPPPRWWWVSCHGGAGVSTLCELIPGGWEAGRAWPNPELGGPPGVLLVCRGNLAGLQAASGVLRQWVAGRVPRYVGVWGLVVVADAPGRTPRSLRAMVDRLSGTCPGTFVVPWVEEWRTGVPQRSNAPKAIAKLGRALESRPWEGHHSQDNEPDEVIAS